LLIVLGVSALVSPIPLTNDLAIDYMFLMWTTVLLWIMSWRGCVGRTKGIAMVVLYIGYMAYAIAHNYGYL
jgi:Ca2+/Na+ antiporter